MIGRDVHSSLHRRASHRLGVGGLRSDGCARNGQSDRREDAVLGRGSNAVEGDGLAPVDVVEERGRRHVLGGVEGIRDLSGTPIDFQSETGLKRPRLRKPATCRATAFE